jgi:hypothetical protein
LAKSLTKLFQQSLRETSTQINEVFFLKQGNEIFFMAEKLLGEARFFNAPALQAVLYQAAVAASKRKFTRATLNKLNRAIDAALNIPA